MTPNPSPAPRHRAVVIGAGMGGLVAARALAAHFAEVVVIDRDACAGSRPRKGVPQGRHAHGLLAGGSDALERLFPGFGAALCAAGGLAGDVHGDSLWFLHGGFLASAPGPLRGYLASRPLVEHVVRGKLLALPNVTPRFDTAVRGLVFDPAGLLVQGVEVDGPEGRGVIEAALVVDASGRGSKLPTWLATAGWPAPEEETIPAEIAYTTQYFRHSPGHFGGRRVVVVGADRPLWRAGVALLTEDDRWIVTLAGYRGDAAPADPEGFAAFAASLPTPELGRLVATAEPLSGFETFRFPGSRRRRYERLDRLPAGVLAFGDSVCSFNPLYGQGMSVAALQAIELGEALSAGDRHLAHRFHAAAARVAETPWRMAAGADRAHPQLAAGADRAQRFFNWYIERLHWAATTDPVLAALFLSVANLKAPPEAILAPSALARIATGLMRRRIRAMVGSGPAPSMVPGA